jgi:type VI secretion system protein ImpK
MRRITELTKDYFNALNQLRGGAREGAELSPELVHSKLRGLVDTMVQRGEELGMQSRDVQDVVYALVALADERALAMSENIRRFWMTNMLQLRYFHENVAGEGFFTRLEGLRRERRRIEVLEVYYLCLLFGFQGKYAIRGGDIELVNLLDVLRAEMGPALEVPDELSPSAERPDDAVGRSRGRTLFWVSLGALTLTVALYAALRVSIVKEAASLREPAPEVKEIEK